MYKSNEIKKNRGEYFCSILYLLSMLIKEFEKKIGKVLKKNCFVLGLDTATKTGWTVLKTTKKKIYFTHGTFKVDTKDTNFKYNEIIDIFQKLIQPKQQVVIEDTFYRFNPAMFRMISRIGAIAYTIAHLKGCEVSYIFATTARKNLGLKGNGKKEEVQAEFLRMTNIKEIDNDIIDSIILALNGALEKLI